MSLQASLTELIAMRKTLLLLGLALAMPTVVLAHHGWGSYDAANPITVQGSIETLKYENPHAQITVKTPAKVWVVTLAPTSRMQTRGAPAELLAVGKTVSAYGYPSTVEKDEMRAERITIDGKTIELR
jgi:uncharacterized protein DUF6152